MSLLLSSSLVACIESVITSDLSGFLPFLKGGATGGVADDMALQLPNQERTQSASRGETEESHTLLLLLPVSIIFILTSSSPHHCWMLLVFIRERWKDREGKKVSHLKEPGYKTLL